MARKKKNQEKCHLINKMIAAINNTIRDYINLDWLTGPFLNKELRVSSRHKRNYFLRAIYVFTMLLFVVITWINVIENNMSMTFQRSRLAEAGQSITITIIWFQFVATQLIAVIMFCNSISDEISHRTLGVLLTTPVSSFQIVMGKLLSKLFQIILLVVISLPLLAVIRVFGGVSWNYIISSLCVTLTAVIFAGSLSMFYSVFFRKTYVIFIMTLLTLGVLYGLFAFLIEIVFEHFHINSNSDFPVSFVIHLNPFLFLAWNTDLLSFGILRLKFFLWPLHCGFMLFASFILLLISTMVLRTIILLQTPWYSSVYKLFQRKTHGKKSKKSDGKIRRVKGSAVVWKELKTRMPSKQKLFVSIIIAIELIMILAMYLFPLVIEQYSYELGFMIYLWVFMGMGVLSVMIFSSSCISSEKESRTWPLLLTTTLNDWSILIGKYLGVLRRSLPVWSLLIIFMIPFLSLNSIGDILYVIISMFFLISGIIFILVGTGIYFSSRFKNTSISVIASFIFAAVLWGFIPFISDFIFQNYITQSININWFEYYNFFRNQIPFLQAAFIMDVIRNEYGRYYRPSHYLLYFTIAYMVIGFVFVWRAKCRFRKNIF